MQHTGVVERVNVKTKAKSGAPLKSPLYSFAMGGEWYGCGFDNPNLTEGDSISFEFTEGQWGKEANVKSISKEAAASPTKGVSHSVNPDARQMSIVYQSSRKDAIHLIEIALVQGAVKLPKTDGYGTLLGLVDDLALDFAKKALAPVFEEESITVEVLSDDE